ncbi:hypothetical protein BDF19DRAFT_448820 [Syncephalis fuscata]|nr:hypothetical protein BDF19DRAFT_448820 [Syncephalis fuscata]
MSRINCRNAAVSALEAAIDAQFYSDIESGDHLKLGTPSLRSNSVSPLNSVLSARAAAMNDNSKPILSTDSESTATTVRQKIKDTQQIDASKPSSLSSNSDSDSQSDESEDEEICMARAVMTPFSAKFATASYVLPQSQSTRPLPRSTSVIFSRKPFDNESITASAGGAPLQRLMTPVIVSARRNITSPIGDQHQIDRVKASQQRRNSLDNPNHRNATQLPARPCSIASPLSPLELSSFPTVTKLGTTSINNRPRARSSIEVHIEIPLIHSAISSAHRTSVEEASPSSPPKSGKMEQPTLSDIPEDFLTQESVGKSNTAIESISDNRKGRPLSFKHPQPALSRNFDTAEVCQSTSSTARPLPLASPKLHRPKSNSISNIMGQSTLKHKNSMSILEAGANSKTITRRGSLPSDMNNIANAHAMGTVDVPPLPGSTHASVTSFLGVIPPPVKSKSPLRKSIGQSLFQDMINSNENPSLSTSTTPKAIPLESTRGQHYMRSSSPASHAAHAKKGSVQLTTSASSRTSISSRRSSFASIASKNSWSERKTSNLDTLEAFIKSHPSLNTDKTAANGQQRSMIDASTNTPSLLISTSVTKSSGSFSPKAKVTTLSVTPVSSLNEECLSKERSLPVAPTCPLPPYFSSSSSSSSSSAANVTSSSSSCLSSSTTNTKMLATASIQDSANFSSSNATNTALSSTPLSNKNRCLNYSQSHGPPPPSGLTSMRLPLIDHDHRIALCVSSTAGFDAFYLLALRKARLLVLSLDGRLTRVTDENGFRLMEKAFREYSAELPTVHWV